MLAAVALDVVVAAGAVSLVLFGGASPIVLVLALVLAIAPWASIIDERGAAPARVAGGRLRPPPRYRDRRRRRGRDSSRSRGTVTTPA